MDTILMNSENNKTSEAHRLRLKVSNRTDLRGGDKRVELSDRSIYYTWKSIKKWYRNNNFEISRIT